MELEKNEEVVNVTNIQYEDGLILSDNVIKINNDYNIEVYGSDTQRASMFADWALCFSEVTNPENTVTNTIFKAKYSPLNEVLNTIRPVFGKYGLTIIQTPYTINAEVYVKTIVTHKDGALMAFPQSTTKLIKPNNAVSEIQAFGSAVSYLRRFSVNAIAGVMGEIDDDGNSLNEKTKANAKQNEEDQKLKPIQDEILALIKKHGGSENETLVTTIKEKYIPNGNPYKLKDVDKLNELKSFLEEYKGDK